jgi:hypothetical protein
MGLQFANGSPTQSVEPTIILPLASTGSRRGQFVAPTPSWVKCKTPYRGEDSPASRGCHRSSAALAGAAMPARTDRAIRADTMIFMTFTPDAIRTTPRRPSSLGVENERASQTLLCCTAHGRVFRCRTRVLHRGPGARCLRENDRHRACRRIGLPPPEVHSLCADMP